MNETNRESPLDVLLAEFQAYLDDEHAWSSRSYKVFVYRLREFGVNGVRPTELVKSAQRRLGTQAVRPDAAAPLSDRPSGRYPS